MADAAMLRPEALAHALSVGSAPGAALLITSNGSLISCAGANGNEDMIASVVSNAWVTYERGASLQMGPLQTLVIQCQMGRVVVAQVVPGLLLCVLAEGTAELKAVEGRVRALQGVLEQPLLKVFPRGAQHVNRPDEIDDEARGE